MTTTAAIMMVRDEADIIATTVCHLLDQVDLVIVADNLSQDGTRDFLNGLAQVHDNLIVGDDADPAYRQSEKMSALAKLAAQRGADWVVPVDADEIWMHPEMPIREFLAQIPADRAIVQADLYDHVATGADDEAETDPVRRLGWRRRKPAKLHKVAVRPNLPVTIEQGNHGAHFEKFRGSPVPGLIIRHFPYRSAEQMTRKSLNGNQALSAADLPYSSGQHWRDYAALENGREGAIGDVFRLWHWVADPYADESLIFDPCPI